MGAQKRARADNESLCGGTVVRTIRLGKASTGAVWPRRELNPGLWKTERIGPWFSNIGMRQDPRESESRTQRPRFIEAGPFHDLGRPEGWEQIYGFTEFPGDSETHLGAKSH